jgi:phage host-nuclease inhibitor protein Gam
MAKRVSKKIISNVSTAQFEEAMAGYAKNDARSLKLAAQMDMEIIKCREKYDPEFNKLMEQMEEQKEIIEVYCREKQDVLFAKKKSHETTHGTVGFRTGTPKLKLLSKFNWAKVLDNLKHYLPDYVRKTEEVAKDRLLADREQEEVAANLKKVGVEVVQDETFFIELKKEEPVTA